MSLKLVLDASDTINVALNRPATQSSISQWSQPNESGRAVNGHRSGSFSFHTLPEDRPWWQVDLETTYPLDAIIVWNRDDEYAARTRYIRIDVSIDGEAWTHVHQGLTYFRGEPTGRPLVHFLDGQVRARYVRISLAERAALHLDQVEVLVSKNHFAAENFWRKIALGANTTLQGLPARDLYRVIKRGSAPVVDLNVSKLQIERFGRFGNNFHQLLNAAVLAPKLEMQEIIVDSDMALVGPVPANGLAIGDVRFLTGRGSEDVGRALAGYFYFVDQFAHIFSSISLQEMCEALRCKVRPLYSDLLSRVPRPIDKSMHFHFRSGDIFDFPVPHGAYAQPPLAFYKAALSHAVASFGVERAVVVYEDKRNPCVDAFIDYLKQSSFEYSEQSGSLAEDLSELLRAKIICYGFGTFAEAILCLSSNAMAAYAFRQVEAFPGLNKPHGAGIREMLLEKGLTLHVFGDSTLSYIKEHAWANTNEQKQLMLAYPLQALDITVVSARAEQR